MKKNVMMRIASILVVAVLLTTCVISGTFAKYVTKGAAEDSARVAKFGVQIKIEGDSSFDNEYASHTDTYTTGATVIARDDKNVVAPGTSYSDTNKMVFSIAGQPEVAVKVDIAFASDYKDVFLKKGFYKDMTKSPYVGAFEVEEDYYPVKWTLKQVGGDTLVNGGTLDQINDKLEAYTGKTYAPKTVLDAQFELTWAWDFESENDEADTLLGNIAADTSLAETAGADKVDDPTFSAITAGDNYNLTINYALTISVTQID